jgi:hypothetical protein
VRIHVCLVSSEAGAKEFVLRKQGAIVPKSIRDHEQWTSLGADFGASAYDPVQHHKTLPQYLLSLRQSCDILVLLVDVRLQHVVADVASACFVAHMEFADWPRTNFANYISSISTRLLRVLSHLLPLLNDGATEQVMLLPFRTFDAQELRDLREACRDALVPNFINTVVSRVEALRNRRRPHRKSGYQDLHYVDDQEKLFDYGLEQHAQLATGEPHTPTCILLGTSRFGRWVPTNRHYNVTKEKGEGTEISGGFVGCHDDAYDVPARSHLNIFCNDQRA